MVSLLQLLVMYEADQQMYPIRGKRPRFPALVCSGVPQMPAERVHGAVLSAGIISGSQGGQAGKGGHAAGKGGSEGK